MLEHYGVALKGRKVVIVGKSLAVGKPLAMMMLVKEATVTVCHKETEDLGEETRWADILCTATGRQGLIKADMVKDGAIVVDIRHGQCNGRQNAPSGRSCQGRRGDRSTHPCETKRDRFCCLDAPECTAPIGRVERRSNTAMPVE
jgi:hypothetical protein